MRLTTDDRARAGFFWMAVAVLGYSVFPIFARDIYSEGALRPSDVAAWRFLLATPTLWLLVAVGRSRAGRPPAGQRPARASASPGRWPLIAMGVLHGCASLPAFFALEHVAAGLYSILFYSYPTLVALLSLALGERLPRVFWLALLGTTAGVALALAPGLQGAEMGESIALGGALALLNAFLVACYFQLSRRILRDTPDVLRAVAWSFVGSLSVLAVLAAVMGLRIPRLAGFCAAPGPGVMQHGAGPGGAQFRYPAPRPAARRSGGDGRTARHRGAGGALAIRIFGGRAIAWRRAHPG